MCDFAVSQEPLIPIWAREGDVVKAGPLGKDPLLGDESVVVPLATSLVLDVRGTLVRTLWLIVVIRHLVGLRLPSVEGGREKKEEAQSETALVQCSLICE